VYDKQRSPPGFRIGAHFIGDKLSKTARRYGLAAKVFGKDYTL